MTTSVPLPLIVIGFVAFFVALWCFVLWLISWVSGWRRLADRFGATVEYGGDIVTFVSARIGLANYNGTLTVGASDQGLYLVPIRIFRPFHRPLLIPWIEIAAHPYKRVGMQHIELTFPNLPGKHVLLYGRSAKQCLPYLHPQTSFDPRMGDDGETRSA